MTRKSLEIVVLLALSLVALTVVYRDSPEDDATLTRQVHHAA